MAENPKKTDAWMPVYIGDYLGATQRLTTEQHGAYLLLLFDYWRNGPPPADDAILSQITRLKPAAWRKMKPVISGFFKQRDGLLYHSRVESERGRASDNQARRTAKAKTAAKVRWDREAAKQDAPSNAPSMPRAMLGGCPPPSPDSVPKGTAAEPPKRSIFDDGADLLVSAGTHSAGSARALVGKWRKAEGEEAVRAAIADAKQGKDGAAISDPAAWIQRRFAVKATEQDSFLADVQRTYGGRAAGKK
jgi:uncharacterized protein YdaU (DUF1376 family)